MATLVSDRHGAGSSGGTGGGDAALLSGLRAGDRDAFEQLYELYRGQIYNLTLRIVHSPEDACDITQEVFIKAFRKLPESPVTDQHLTPWLYRVAVNASYDHLRTRRQHRDIDDLGAESRAVPVDGFEQAEMGRRVEQTLAAVSERHRTVLVLKDIHGLRHDEIAEILGISRNAAETLLFRARDAFRVKYLELTQGQPGSHNVEKWSAAGIGLGVFLHQAPLPAALQGGFPFGAAAAGGAGAAASGAGSAASGAGSSAAAGTTGATAAGAAAGGAGGASTGMSLAAGGLLAKVGGIATAKIATVVIAATVAAGGGAAAYETGALPGLHQGPPPKTAHSAQTHAGAGESSRPAVRTPSRDRGTPRRRRARPRARPRRPAPPRRRLPATSRRATRASPTRPTRRPKRPRRRRTRPPREPRRRRSGLRPRRPRTTTAAATPAATAGTRTPAATAAATAATRTPAGTAAATAATRTPAAAGAAGTPTPAATAAAGAAELQRRRQQRRRQRGLQRRRQQRRRELRQAGQARQGRLTARCDPSPPAPAEARRAAREARPLAPDSSSALAHSAVAPRP